MFPKKRRLSAHEVAQVLSRGRSVRAGALSAKFMKHEGAARGAVVVSKSLVRKAVKRNRVRRALWRALQNSQFPTLMGEDILFFVQRIPKDPLSGAFHTDLQDLLKKIT